MQCLMRGHALRVAERQTLGLLLKLIEPLGHVGVPGRQRAHTQGQR